MADTTTTNYNLVKPELDASDDTWGEKLNSDLDTIDTVLNDKLDKTGDGSNLTGIDALPSQTGSSGKYLGTDGSTATWSTVQAGSAYTESSAAPSSPSNGDMWMDTDDDILYQYQTGVWVQISHGAFNTGVAGIQSAADATAISIDSSERVGIGITSPTAKLHLKGDGGVFKINSTTNSGGVGLDITDHGSGTQIGYYRYHHADSQSFGGGNAHVFSGTETVTNLVINGGNLIATGNVTAYYSDERLKNFEGNIPNALDKINSLGGYYFTENETAKKLGYDNDRRQVGVNAQEVEKVLPELVSIAPISYKEGVTEEYKTVDYEKLTAVLIEAVKELSQEIEKLKEA